MLVVSRKKGETIVIGDPENPIATVMIVDIRGDKVRLGIEAERSVNIHRQEIADAILAERERECPQPPPPKQPTA